MARWDPWRGCHRYSEGCKFCYTHKGDCKRGIDTNQIVKTDKFYAPVMKDKKGKYKMKSGQLVYLCFSSDFLVQEADQWRQECWEMIKERWDLTFLFLTKRIERFMECIPSDWGEGYDNVVVSCTVENQDRADFRLSIFKELPIKHKNIVCQPLIERIDISEYLNHIDLVVVGGESDKNARPLDYQWVLDIREQCIKHDVSFEFRQCGTHFIKDGKEYTLKVRDLFSQARKADINVWRSKKKEALLVIDVQEEYMKKYNENLIEKINQRIQYFSEKQQLIVFVKNIRKLRSGTTIYEFAEKLQVCSPYIVKKEAVSVFSNSELQKILTEYEITEIEIIGVDGNSCVFASAIDAQKIGYKVCLPLEYIGIQNLERFEKKKAVLQKKGIVVK